MDAMSNSFYRLDTTTFARVGRGIKAGLRRAFELAGAPYADGKAAPM